MTTTEIFEYNKRCAEFLGWKYCENDLVFNSKMDGHPPHNSVFSGWVKKEQPYTKGVPLFVAKQNKMEIEYKRKLLFHSDWNWVMEVVDAIEDIIFDEDNSFNVTIGSTNYCVIQDSNGEVFETIQDYGNSKLETVVLAINQFLIWYNDSTRN